MTSSQKALVVALTVLACVLGVVGLAGLGATMFVGAPYASSNADTLSTSSPASPADRLPAPSRLTRNESKNPRDVKFVAPRDTQPVAPVRPTSNQSSAAVATQGSAASAPSSSNDPSSPERLYREGAYATAASILETRVVSLSNPAASYRLLGRCYYALGRPRDAVVAFVKGGVSANGPDPEAGLLRKAMERSK